jgi:hypothetical protein
MNTGVAVALGAPVLIHRKALYHSSRWLTSQLLPVPTVQPQSQFRRKKSQRCSRWALYVSCAAAAAEEAAVGKG